MQEVRTSVTDAPTMHLLLWSLSINTTETLDPKPPACRSATSMVDVVTFDGNATEVALDLATANMLQLKRGHSTTMFLTAANRPFGKQRLQWRLCKETQWRRHLTPWQCFAIPYAPPTTPHQNQRQSRRTSNRGQTLGGKRTTNAKKGPTCKKNEMIVHQVFVSLLAQVTVKLLRKWQGWSTGCVLVIIIWDCMPPGDGPRQLLKISWSAAQGCTRAEQPRTRAEPPRAPRGTHENLRCVLSLNARVRQSPSLRRRPQQGG